MTNPENLPPAVAEIMCELARLNVKIQNTANVLDDVLCLMRDDIAGSFTTADIAELRARLFDIR